jgi:hypothetical protein
LQSGITWLVQCVHKPVTEPGAKEADVHAIRSSLEDR